LQPVTVAGYANCGRVDSGAIGPPALRVGMRPQEQAFAVCGVIANGADHTNDPVDGNGGFCMEGYWVLQADGPWLLDFTAVHQEIARVIPRDATAPQTGCWALSIDNAEVRSAIQLKGAECRACGYVGTAFVHFKVKDHRAVPVSSSFE